MAWDILVFFLLTLITLSRYLRDLSVVEPATVLIVYCLFLAIRKHRKQQRIDFVNQLKSHRKELRAGATVEVNGLLLRYSTTVTTYSFSIGTLISSLTIPSVYRVYRNEQPFEALFYSLITLLTGWWSIMGPLTTLNIVAQNTGGGKTQSIAELIDRAYLEKQGDYNMLCEKTSQA